MDITIVVGNCCNLDCDYCFEPFKNKGVNKAISLTSIEKFFELLFGDADVFKQNKNDSQTLLLTGGEPLLYIDTLDNISSLYIDKLNKNSYRKPQIWVNTNGLLLETEKVKTFSEKYADYLNYNCNLDTKTIVNNSNKSNDIRFSIIVNKLKAKKQINWVVNKDDLVHIPEIIRFIVSNDLSVEPHWDKKLGLLDNSDVLKDAFHQIMDWYLNQDNNWILEHKIKLFHNRYTSQFIAKLTGEEVCGGNQCTLDFNGNIVKCMHCSSLCLGNEKGWYNFGNIDNPDEINWVEARKRCTADRNLCGYIDSECYRCSIGSQCGKCDAFNACFEGGKHIWDKNICNIKAFDHLLNVFFYNSWISVYIDLISKPDIKVLNNGIKIFAKDMPLVNINICKDWALKIMYEEDYNKLADITEKIGGIITPLQKQFYSFEEKVFIEEQLKELRE